MKYTQVLSARDGQFTIAFPEQPSAKPCGLSRGGANPWIGVA